MKKKKKDWPLIWEYVSLESIELLNQVENCNLNVHQGLNDTDFRTNKIQIRTIDLLSILQIALVALEPTPLSEVINNTYTKQTIIPPKYTKIHIKARIDLIFKYRIKPTHNLMEIMKQIKLTIDALKMLQRQLKTKRIVNIII